MEMSFDVTPLTSHGL